MLSCNTFNFTDKIKRMNTVETTKINSETQYSLK